MLLGIRDKVEVEDINNSRKKAIKRKIRQKWSIAADSSSVAVSLAGSGDTSYFHINELTETTKTALVPVGLIDRLRSCNEVSSIIKENGDNITDADLLGAINAAFTRIKAGRLNVRSNQIDAITNVREAMTLVGIDKSLIDAAIAELVATGGKNGN